MKIAYVTIDPVNEMLAAKLAAECRLDLEPLEPRDRRDGFDRFVLDWDSLPPTSRQDLLKELKARPTPAAVAAHSYHLDEDDLAAFGIRGVKVFRHLTHDTLLSLQPSAGHSAA
jgi:hypothetical protein